MCAVELIDTHAHLTADPFADDLPAVVARAEEAGVTRIVTLGTDVDTSRSAIELAERFPTLFAAVGIHPEAVSRARLDDVETIGQLARHAKVVAIGEIGLDYYWDKTTAEIQQAFFEKQLRLAADLGLPVSIHDRDAHDKIMATLKSVRTEKGDDLKGVLHSFSGNLTMAREAVELGLMISLGGPVTFLNARELVTLVPQIQLERMMIETDSPYLSPHPLRGRRNEPANIRLVAQRVAELKGLTFEQVAEQTRANARLFFSFS